MNVRLIALIFALIFLIVRLIAIKKINRNAALVIMHAGYNRSFLTLED